MAIELIPHGDQSLAVRERRIARSRVASGIPCVRAVATMSRSAGSPRNRVGKLSTAITTSRSSGRTVRTRDSVARVNQSENGSGSCKRCLECRSCASHKLMAARYTPPASAAASSAFLSAGLRGDLGVSHQIQKCVSRSKINAGPQNPPRAQPIHLAQQAIHLPGPVAAAKA